MCEDARGQGELGCGDGVGLDMGGVLGIPIWDWVERSAPHSEWPWLSAVPRIQSGFG